MKKILLTTVIASCMGYAIAQPTAGLVAYWPMNGNFIDAGPNNITVTNNGATATTNVSGNPNAAMNFSNPASTVVQFASQSVNSNVNFSTSQDFSIAFTVYASSPFIHTGGFYDNNLNYSGPGVWFWNANGYPQIQFNFKNGSVGTTNGAFPVGAWKHVCCVRSGASLLIYINGVLNVTGTAGSSAPVYNYPARFGTMFFTGMTPPEYNGFNGKLDEFRIYNRALTAAEILGMSGGALPVKLTSFTASHKNNMVSLKWQTQYEQNSSHYNIERSTDGMNFSNVARTSAAGNSNLPLGYSCTDLLPASIQSQKTIFYRLQSVDIDGQFAYSKVLALQLDKEDMELFVSPNPAKDVLQVQTGSRMGGNASLMIADISGRVLYKKEIMLQPGTNTVPVNISLLSPGMYIVKLQNGGDNYIKQFIKE